MSRSATVRSFILLAALIPLLLSGSFAPASAQNALSALTAPDNSADAYQGELPPDAILMRPLQPQELVSFAFTLPLRDQIGLDALLHRLYDPGDPEHGQWLTSQEFTDRFGPTADDYAVLQQFAVNAGFTIDTTYVNRAVLDVTAPAGAIQSAFGVALASYRNSDGREYVSPITPTLLMPVALQQLHAGVIGLNQSLKIKPAIASSAQVVANIGSGPAGGYTPAEFNMAYFIAPIHDAGYSGEEQSLALVEMDGYHASDIDAYEQQYGLRHVPLKNVLLDHWGGGVSQSPKENGGDVVSAAEEVAMDIELMIAVAPQVKAITVYEAGDDALLASSDTQHFLDIINTIADDDSASCVSSSWGWGEADFVQYAGKNAATSEDGIFQEMAAQGQSFFSASGDNGAYESNTTTNPTVTYPTSDPYVTGVGATTLTLTSDDFIDSESAWSDSGGGDSAIFTQPEYQSQASSAIALPNRLVPDVALDGDPRTPYSIYCNFPNTGSNWKSAGGTSAAAPIWAAYMSLVDEACLDNDLPTIGQSNPALYNIASDYIADFDDFIDTQTGSNSVYSAGPGYDLLTGLGTLDGYHLWDDLSNTKPLPAPTQLKVYSNGGDSDWDYGVVLSLMYNPDLDKFKLYRSLSPGGEGSNNNQIVRECYGYGANAGLNYIEDPFPIPGTTYYYKVTAYDWHMESPYSAEVSVKVPGVPVRLLLLSPSSVQGGATTTANRVYLAGNAASNTIVSLYSYDDSIAAVPASVTIAAGSSSHAFTITTSAVSSPQTVTIGASIAGSYQQVDLTVNPPPLIFKSVVLSPATTKGGTSTTTNRVYWTGNAPATETVSLKSSNTAVATVPSTVAISSGASSHVFTITTKPVTSQQTVTITATSSGVTQSATLTVTPENAISKVRNCVCRCLSAGLERCPTQ